MSSMSLLCVVFSASGTTQAGLVFFYNEKSYDMTWDDKSTASLVATLSVSELRYNTSSIT